MRRRRLAAVLMASAGFAGLTVRGARADIAATFTGSGGNWGTAGNWSVDAVPINAGTKLYDVTIGSSTVSFNVPGNGQIDALAMSGTTLNLQTGCNLSVPNGGPVADANVTAGGATFSDNEPSSNLASTSLTAENVGGISFPQITTVVTDSSQESYLTASGPGRPFRWPT
jgi:hypothetical protein